MKKLLLVTQGFPFGNSERGFLDTEYKYLKKKFEVYTLAISDMEVLSDERAKVIHDYKVGGIEFISQIKRKEVLVDIKMAVKDAGWGVILRRIKRIMSYSARAEHMQSVLERIIREKGIDVIYTYWCLPATVAACRLKDKYNFSVVTRFHGFDLYKFREDCGWQPLRQYISNKANLLVFACETGKEYYNKEICNCLEKTYVSFLGTKKYEQINSKKHGALRVVSCSNVIPLKRVDMIARVIHRVSKIFNIEWYHIGGPEQTFSFLDMDGISYHMFGAVEHEKIMELYKTIQPDIFITLSTSEGVPVSVQEAMSMGIPILATDVGGMREIVINNYNGILLPVNCTEEEVSKMLIWFNYLNCKERDILSKNAIQVWSDKCDASKNAKKFTNKLVEL